MDEIELGKRQSKGQRAQELLDNEAFKTTLTYLHDEYLTAWRNTRLKDVGARENLFLAINILDKIHEHLKKLVVNGKIATKDLAGMKYLKR